MRRLALSWGRSRFLLGEVVVDSVASMAALVFESIKSTSSTTSTVHGRPPGTKNSSTAPSGRLASLRNECVSVHDGSSRAESACP
jgi:hypothetical protein